MSHSVKSKLVRNSLVLAISQAIAMYARAEPPTGPCIVGSASDAGLLDNGLKTFRGCLADVEANSVPEADFTIAFAPALKGSTITFDASNPPNNYAAFSVEIFGADSVGSLTIDGDIDNDGAPDITIDGDNRLDAVGEDVRTLVINTSISGDITLDGLILTGGQMVEAQSTSYSAAQGTALFVNGEDANITLKNSVISGNVSGDITTEQCDSSNDENSIAYIKSRNALVSGTTLSDNTGCQGHNTLVVNSKYGRGENDGRVTLDNVLVDNNQGSGAELVGRNVSINNSRIERNAFGAIIVTTSKYNGNASSPALPTISISNSSVADNTLGGVFTLSYGFLPQVLLEQSSITGNRNAIKAGSNKYLPGGLLSILVGADFGLRDYEGSADPAVPAVPLLPSSRLQIVNSTISGNTTGPAAVVFGITLQEEANLVTDDKYLDVDIRNSTIIGSEASDSYLQPGVATLGALKYSNNGSPGIRRGSAAGVNKLSVSNSIITGATSGDTVGSSCLAIEKYDVITVPADSNAVPQVQEQTEKYAAIYPAFGRRNIVSNAGTLPFNNLLGSGSIDSGVVLNKDSCGKAVFDTPQDKNAVVIGGEAEGDPASLAAVLDTELLRFGGITKVHSLVTGSIAIDGGDNDSATYKPLITIGSVNDDSVALTTDQRGFARPEWPSGVVDIGAYEFTSDVDGDGAADNEEDAVPGTNGSNQGDGNDDGTADGEQLDVTSRQIVNTGATPIVVGGSNAYSTLTAVDPSNGNNVLQLSNVGWNETSAPTPPDGAAFPLGGLSFTASGLTGIQANFELYVPAASGVNTLYKQVGVNSTWTEVPSTRTVVGDKIKFTFSLEDGGQFDVDGSANGNIVDPIFPALSTSATPVPVMPLSGLSLLGALLALLGLRASKARR